MMRLLTTLVSFIRVCLALVPTLALALKTPSLFLYPPYLPFPVLEALTAATALWSLSYLPRTQHHRIRFLVNNNHYNHISNSTNNFQPPPSNRHIYFAYPVLLSFQTSCTASNVERQCFQTCMVGCTGLGSS